MSNKPLNMTPEDYARSIIDAQAEVIAGMGDEFQGGTVIFEYSFSAAATEPPGANQLRIDVATSSAATKVWANKITSNGIDVTNAMANFHSGDRVTLQKKNDASVYARFNLTADPILKSSYFELPVTFSVGGSALMGGQPTLLVLAKIR